MVCVSAEIILCYANLRVLHKGCGYSKSKPRPAQKHSHQSTLQDKEDGLINAETQTNFIEKFFGCQCQQGKTNDNLKVLKIQSEKFIRSCSSKFVL